MIFTCDCGFLTTLGKSSIRIDGVLYQSLYKPTLDLFTVWVEKHNVYTLHEDLKNDVAEGTQVQHHHIHTIVSAKECPLCGGSVEKILKDAKR